MDFLNDLMRNNITYIGLMLLSAVMLVGVYQFIRRSGPAGLQAALRGKGSRLQIVESLSVHGPGRRTLLLVRRDGVEHLVMIGGPNDLVVEQTIIKGMPMGTVPGLSHTLNVGRTAVNRLEEMPAPQAANFTSSPRSTATAQIVAAAAERYTRPHRASERASDHLDNARAAEPLAAPTPPSAPLTVSAPLQRTLQERTPIAEPRVSPYAPPLPAQRNEPTSARGAPKSSQEQELLSQESPLDDIASRLEEALMFDQDDLTLDQTNPPQQGFNAQGNAAHSSVEPTNTAQPPVGQNNSASGPRPPKGLLTTPTSGPAAWLRGKIGPSEGPGKPLGRAPNELAADRLRFDQMVAQMTVANTDPSPLNSDEPNPTGRPQSGNAGSIDDEMTRLLGELSGPAPQAPPATLPPAPPALKGR